MVVSPPPHPGTQLTKSYGSASTTSLLWSQGTKVHVTHGSFGFRLGNAFGVVKFLVFDGMLEEK